MTEYRLIEGHPPAGELSIRVTMSRTFKPNLEQYDGCEDVLDAMLMDMETIENGNMDYHEVLFPIAEDDEATEGTWEIVDDEGTVWSECLEEEETTTAD